MEVHVCGKCRHSVWPGTKQCPNCGSTKIRILGSSRGEPGLLARLFGREKFQEQGLPTASTGDVNAVPSYDWPQRLEDERTRLVASGLLINFVREKNAAWNHEDWLNFLDGVRRARYRTLSDNEVGRLLEEEKALALTAESYAYRNCPVYPCTHVHVSR